MKQQAAGGRERWGLDRDWRFHAGDFPLPDGHGAWMKAAAFDFEPIAADLDDSAWRLVQVPHDFVIEGRFVPADRALPGKASDPSLARRRRNYANHGSLPGGVGWYRKRFRLPAGDRRKRLTLEFDGVYRDSMVWLNQHFLGRSPSGYIGFRYDITDIAVCGGVNTLVVRADARDYEGWFYEGGGLYRHVWLLKTHSLHVAPDGVFAAAEVRTSAGGQPAAALALRVAVRNGSDRPRRGRVVAGVSDPSGHSAGRAEGAFSIPPGEAQEVALALALDNPALWSTDNPALYSAAVAVVEQGRTVDGCRLPFGIRSFRFDPDRGFFLNGRPLKLKGLCCHQDHAGVGAALPDRLQAWRVERLKAMGCNAYRCVHHPPAPELLEACDRLGLLVMDETRLLSSAPEYLSQLERLVLRDRNHPSIILWSLGNEEMALQGTEAGARIAAAMKRAVARLDPTRPVTLAMNGAWGEGASRAVDVQGCNYIRAGDVDAFHRRFPRQPVLYSEASAALAARGVYARDAGRGYESAYDRNVPGFGSPAEANWKHCLARPFVAGTFVWSGFDYRGEPLPFEWPCIGSQFGVMDACGFPKDTYYYYQAWWSGKPTRHLFPHWTWPGREGRRIEVWVHTNAEEVELFLNGRSLGRKRIRRASHAAWSVAYQPGVLLARGFFKSGPPLAASAETAGAPRRIRILPDRAALRADGEDTACVRVEILDERDRLVPTADLELSFSIAGKARIIGVGNGNPSSHEPDKALCRRAFNGLCQVLVQTTRRGGPLVLSARAPGLEEAAVRLRSIPVRLRLALDSVSAGRRRAGTC